MAPAFAFTLPAHRPGLNSISCAAYNERETSKEAGMQVLAAIRLKRAIRSFRAEPLPPDAIDSILYAGRRAQSAKNRQVWHFIAITDRGTLEQLSQLGHFAGHLATAAFGVCILTPDPSQRWSILFDAGQAAAYMQLAAWEMGIGSCLATIYEPDQARQLLEFPADWYLHVAISFGYPEDPQELSRPPRAGGRSDPMQVISFNRWGRTSRS
jgi:nitroreductase